MKSKNRFLLSCLFVCGLLLSACSGSNKGSGSQSASQASGSETSSSQQSSSGSDSSEEGSSSTPVTEYTVRFLNGETILQSGKVAAGGYATYSGATPVKESTAAKVFTFRAWDKDPATTVINQDTDFNALFDEATRKYQVQFKNEGVVLQDTQVDYGTYATYNGETPVKESTAELVYTFTGWDVDPAGTLIVEDTVFNAEFSSNARTYEVKFMDGEEELQKSSVAYGQYATYNGGSLTKTVDGITYKFEKWDKEPALTQITTDTVFTAQYKAVALVKDFEKLAENDAFGGWTAVKEDNNTYIKASGSGWLTPIDTALLYNDELGLTDNFTMSAKVYLVGNVAGNISFTSNSFSENNADTFNKFVFWHTDENNGYAQIKKNATDSSDGDNLFDAGWIAGHGSITAENVGSVLHNAWATIKLVRNGNKVSLWFNDAQMINEQELAGLTALKDVKFRICMASDTAEVRLDDFEIRVNEIANDFNGLQEGAKFGGWSVVKDGGNSYLEANGSTWVDPVQTARLFDGEIELGDRWDMSAKLYLVGHVAGNISFVSNSFSENNADTFNKFFFWHTDENNGYIQVRKNCTDTSDGDVMFDPGWLTLHEGFTDATVGEQVHDTWVNVRMVRNGDTFNMYVADIIVLEGASAAQFTNMRDIAFRIAMSSVEGTVRLDDFAIRTF